MTVFASAAVQPAAAQPAAAQPAAAQPAAAQPPDTPLLAETFDAGDAAGRWNVLSHGGDVLADFAFDYSTRGIPPAPQSAGTTIGFKLRVNGNDAVAAKDAASAYPTGQSFSGDHALLFDLWLNYNGGAGGGTGSTQFATAGLCHGGTQVVWTDNPASDGLWCAVTGEGGDADDYRAYRGATLFGIPAGGYAAGSRNHNAPFYLNLFPTPPFETTGAPGKQWVEVEVRRRGTVLTWRINGRVIAIRPDSATLTGDVLLGCMDTYPSVASPPDDTFALFDNVRVVAPDCNGNGTADAEDLAAGTSLDCNGTGVPDECEPVGGGDLDVDGDFDRDDLNVLGTAMAGPGLPPTPGVPACAALCLAAFDVDGDGALDLADFAPLQPLGSIGPFAHRPAGAVSGSTLLAEVAGISQTAREARVQQEILAGNVPGFLRAFVPIEVTALIGGEPVEATYWVAPDYLCLGRDDDFVRMPMTPLIAQPIADALGCLLPTRRMVDQIWAAAAVKLAPAPISPATVDITLATTYYRHHEMIEVQRAGQPLGLLIAGIKKDVVITPLLVSNPGKVAIYGWHYQNGTPIQPLYLGHGISYVDYSHGIRLVRERMLVNGVEMCVADVLADPALHVLLSDEGVVTTPHY